MSTTTHTGVTIVKRKQHRLTVSLLLAALATTAVLPTTPVVAEEVATPDFEVLAETLPVVGDDEDGLQVWTGSGTAPSAGMVLWPEGRRAFQIARYGSSGPPAVISAWDLDRFEEIARSEPLDPPGYLGTEEHYLRPEQIALDRTGGVLFFPHTVTRGIPTLGTLNPDPIASCQGQQSTCFGGIHVLDARTLDPVAGLVENPIRFRGVGLDGTIGSPRLLAATFAPGGTAGKLLLLVDEQVHSRRGVAAPDPRSTRTPHWLVQVDVATGHHDWVEPLSGCTSRRSGIESTNSELQPRNVLFRHDGSRPAIYVGCYRSNGGGAIVRVVLDERDPTGAPVAQEAFPGPGRVQRMHADPASQRILMMSEASNDEVWWVFDGQVSTWLTTIGIGRASATRRASGVDPASGRLYVMSLPFQGGPSGLLITDARRIPVPQVLEYDGLNHLNSQNVNVNPLYVDPAGPDRPRRIFFRPGRNEVDHYHVIADHRPVADEVLSAEDLLEAGAQAFPPSDDVPEVAGLTRPTFTGTARNYGLRTILIGGTEAVWLPPSPDNLASTIGGQTDTDGQDSLGVERPRRGGDPCGRREREFAFGVTGSLGVVSDLTPGKSAAVAVPAVTDDQTVQDLADPVGRCLGAWIDHLRGLRVVAVDEAVDEVADSLDDLLRQAGIRPPPRSGIPPSNEEGDEDPLGSVDRPGHTWDFEQASCVAPDDDQRHTSDESGNDTMPTSTFSAAVECHDDVLSAGRSVARFVSTGPVTVTEAYSEFRIERDTVTGGLVSSAYSYARGIGVEVPVTLPSGEVGSSTITIDKVETRAESWANGRSQPAGVDDDCDRSRTAGTCIGRTLAGITVVNGITGQTHSCRQCTADNDQMVAAMERALGADWQVRLREPDQRLALGAPNGTQAAVQKREVDGAADAALLSDRLVTLPTLEVVRVNDNSERRGRQVYQFAGVELSTTYAVQCLGILEAGGCVQPPVPLAQIGIHLTDALDGTPLAGGRFSLNLDSPFPGATAPDGPATCTTDTRGRCELVGLPAGRYTVTQTGAPGDYAPAGSLTRDLAPGGRFDVEVTNVRQIGAVEVGLTDLDGAPLPGGVFELITDAAGDGAVGLDDAQTAVCTTGPAGSCAMTEVPLGAYVLRQAAAPAGFIPVDDQVPFVLDQPGQTAGITFSNAPEFAVSDGSGAAAGASFDGFTTDDTLPPAQLVAIDTTPAPQIAPGGAPDSFGQRLLQLPRDGLALLRRSPVQATAFGALLLLAAAAVNGPLRRRLFTQATSA